MNTKLKFGNFRINKRTFILILVLSISLIARIWYAAYDTSVWWDGAIYVGMGKYISSGGVVGFWEIFRPPLFPLFYSVLYTFHIPLVLIGKTVVVVASIGAIWMSYILAESIQKGSGVFASIFLSVTPVFFSFSKIPITDIVSVFFLLVALVLFQKNKNYFTGIAIGIAFLLRFPQGLLLVPLIIIVLYNSYNTVFFLWIKETFIKGGLVVLGFATLAVPYFFSNYLFYGDIFIPLVLGNAVIGGYSYLYDLGFWYYAIELGRTAPFLWLSIFTPLLLIKTIFTLSPESRKNLQLVVVTAFIFCSYFFWQSHKELRYSIAFVPYLAILSGVIFWYLYSYLSKKKFLLVITITLFTVYLYHSFPYLLKKQADNPLGPVYTAMSTLHGHYISTTPVPIIFSDIRIVEFFDSTITLEDALTRRAASLDGVIVTMCDLTCPTDDSTKTACNSRVENTVAKYTFKKVYDATINQCTFLIFKK